MSKENKGHQNNEDQTENVDLFDLENSDELMNLATNPRALTDDDFAESKVELRGQYDSFDTTNKARYTEQDIQVLEVLKPCANVRACISVIQVRAACTI